MYTRQALRKILKDVESRNLSVKKALHKLKDLPYESFSFARIDHHRNFRKGYPEAIYAPGKTFDQLVKIIQSVNRSKQNLILTRLEKEVWQKLQTLFPKLQYSEPGRLAYFKNLKKFSGKPVAVLTAGTSDLFVAEEARVTLELIGKKVETFYDCGVAGFHRLLDQLPKLRKCSVIICIAGMDGVLPSVTAGLVDRPVIAVPTSVGYGANFKGMAPLLTMLNSCAQGVTVVNIDNGFGAACFAALI
jgi:pyridinium-3,5-biscarboxylic acid mononucleotide synthase